MGTRREQRLRRRRDIAAVYRRGEARRVKLVTVRVIRTAFPISRFGFAVPASTGNAVLRNRVRRRLREIMTGLPVAPGWDVMLTARPGARTASFQELRGGVESALLGLRVLEEQ